MLSHKSCGRWSTLITDFRSESESSVPRQATMMLSGVIGLLMLVGAFLAMKKPPKPPPPPPPQLCQALSDVYVNATTSADLQVVLPPGAVQPPVLTLYAREDAPTNPWSQCINNQICPIGLAGFQDCKNRGADPRDGAPIYGCLFRNNADRARRARLVVTYKHTKTCCAP